MAIAPISYATAYENLGDIYAKMASQAYDKALQLDKGNAAAQTKLELIKDLFSSGQRPAKTASGRTSATGAIASAQAPTKSAGSAAATSPAPTVSASATPAASAKPAQAELSASPKAAEKPAEKSAGSDQAGEVIKTVKDWAKAWSDKDAAKYLSFYAKDFKTPGGENRAAWESARKDRIAKPKKIQVAVLDPQVKFTDADHAVVSFKQSYRSDAMKSSAAKTLTLVKTNGKWQIQQEQVGR